MSYVFVRGEFGENLPPPWINLCPKKTYSELSREIATLQKPITLLGHSYGAFVAMQLVGYDTLILVAPIGLSPRLGYLGQFFAVFFLLFGELSYKHIGWRNFGFEWLDVVEAPPNSTIYLGLYDYIIPVSSVSAPKSTIVVVNAGHHLTDFHIT